MEASGILRNVRKQESAMEHVFNAVVDSIIDNRLRPGDKLPTELELSQNLGVGRNTVREAIKTLEAYGVVSIRRPEGTFVCDAYSAKMLNPMMYGILLQKSDWSDLIRLRGALEIGTLFQACHQVQPSDISDLENIVQDISREMSREFPSIDGIIEYDSRFHSRIVHIIGSNLILDVTGYITKFTIPSRKRTTQMVLRKGEVDSFIQKHHDIVDVLRNRDYNSIEKVVMSHYEYWNETD